MNRIANWKKQRREYLWKRGARITGANIAALLIVPAFGVAAVCILIALWMQSMEFMPFPALLLCGVSAASGLFIKLAMFLGYHWLDAAAKLPYIPPVTPDALPSNEILVRSASEPFAPAEMLMRPAAASNEKGVGQLLRSIREEQGASIQA